MPPIAAFIVIMISAAIFETTVNIAPLRPSRPASPPLSRRAVVTMASATRLKAPYDIYLAEMLRKTSRLQREKPLDNHAHRLISRATERRPFTLSYFSATGEALPLLRYLDKPRQHLERGTARRANFNRELKIEGQERAFGMIASGSREMLERHR